MGELVFEHMAMLRKFPLFYDRIRGIVLHPGDEIDLLAGPSAKQRIVVYMPDNRHDGSGSEGKGRSHPHIHHLPLRDHGKRRKVPIMVQKQMQFDGPLGPSETGPVEHRQAEIDRGGVEADQLLLEPELLFPSPLHPATLQRLEEDLFIKLPGAMLVAIGQGGAAGSGDAQMLELPFTACEASGDLPEGMGSAQLAKEHGDELSPAAEARA